MLPYQLEHIFSYSAQLHPPEIIGPVAEGIRANFYVASGEVSGPRVRGLWPGRLPKFCTGRVAAAVSHPSGHADADCSPSLPMLNRIQCLNIGEVDSARLTVRYDVYAVRCGLASPT